VPAVRRALAAEDPALPLVRPTTLALWSRTASFVQRIGATVLMVLGTVALLLAAVGLYGVTAYTVARRTREIGVRVALGATTRRVVAGVLRDGGRTAAAGLVLGTVAAFAAARLLAAQLQGVRADDPAVFGAAGLLLLAVALAASWLPARRAARVPPTEALRAD
jgi:ABC-type antimicrobial peptide transport system permease subunit